MFRTNTVIAHEKDTKIIDEAKYIPKKQKKTHWKLMTFVDISVLYVICYTNFLVEIHCSYSSKLVYTLSQDILDSHFAELLDIYKYPRIQ